MKLPFLDRAEESARLRRFCAADTSALCVVWGRRRCGKSRLVREVLPSERTVHFVGDEREAGLQRAALARQIGPLLPGFERVEYPGWEPLLERWWAQAPPGAVLAVDELPFLVAAAPELPSLLQKFVDRQAAGGPHLLLAGSSQRMMQGLALDARAPLFGRAVALLEVAPLPAGWIGEALGLDPVRAVEAYAVWGGVPRYWELAADHPSLGAAVRELVLSPLGVLHDEPRTLLLDDLREIAQAASVLALIGQGCHRLSEIAGRLGKPATALSGPLRRLVQLRLVRRDVPFGASEREGKRSLYRIADPFLRFWFRHVEPNRSRLDARQEAQVWDELAGVLPGLVAGVWEQLVREAVLRGEWLDRTWRAVGPWWGAGLDRRPHEIDVVAESSDGRTLLLGEVEWTARPDLPRLAAELREKARTFPLAAERELRLAVWAREPPDRPVDPDLAVFGPADVLAALR